MLGKNREIFFPRLEKEQMMTFDKIAINLLQEYKYDIEMCNSDEEAIEKAVLLKHGSNRYPVHFSISDTSGEKPYEEFYTETEKIDMNRLQALGVVTNKGIPDQGRIDLLFQKLNRAFDEVTTTKDDVIAIMKEYLPNFEHIETGKSLDSKM